MKNISIFLPFLALLVGTIGTAAGSAFPELKFLTIGGWVLAAVLVGVWIALDIETFKRMFARKGAKYGASSGLVVLLGLVVIIGLAVVSSRARFNKSVDLSRDKANTLSEQTLKLGEQIKAKGKPVQVTAYFIDEQIKAQFRDLIQLYQSAGLDMQVEYIDPQTNPTRAMADKISDGNTAILKFGAQEKRINTFNEEKITNAIVNVLKDKQKKIYFTKGHGEGDLRGTEPTSFGEAVKELEGNKNEVAELSLLESAKVPEDADALIVAGPKYDFKEEEVRILEDFVKRGGSLLLMVNALTPVDTINKFAEKFGVRFNNDFLLLSPNDGRAMLIGQNNAVVSKFDEFNPVTKDYARQSAVAVIMPFTRSVEKVEDNPNKMKVTLAGSTADFIMKVKDVQKASDLENVNQARTEMGSFPVIAVANGKPQAPATAANDKNAGTGDTKKDTPGAASAGASGKESRVIAVGSTEFANNRGAATPENRDMFLNMTNYLLQDDDFIAIRPKDPTKSTIHLSSGGSQLLLLILAFVFPFSFLIFGGIVWFQRRAA